MILILVMGVSGSGKTTLGKRLSEELSFTFFDADDFHFEACKVKMSKGIPLNDEDRLPWLRRINGIMVDAVQNKNIVLACSALKEKYRNILFENINNVRIILINGDFDLIRNRIDNRQSHFMKSSLLQSQFDTLEKPFNSIAVDASLSNSDQVAIVLRELNKLTNE